MFALCGAIYCNTSTVGQYYHQRFKRYLVIRIGLPFIFTEGINDIQVEPNARSTPHEHFGKKWVKFEPN